MHFGQVGVYGAHAVMEPAGFGAVDKIGDNVKRIWVVDLCVDDVRYGFVVEVDLPKAVSASGLRQ